MQLPVQGHVLYDAPQSNHGARIRYMLYKKKADNLVLVKPPSELGGIKSDEYLQLNPYGKMPLLKLPDGSTLYESEVIMQYLLSILNTNQGTEEPSFVPFNPRDVARANLIVRILDLNISPNQGCMYKKMPIETRATCIKALSQALDALEAQAHPQGPYLLGSQLTYADAACIPTLFFLYYMLPRFFGWPQIFRGKPKLAAWWDFMQQDAEATRVLDEIEGVFKQWEEKDRWVKQGIVEHVKDSNYAWDPEVGQA